MWVITLFLFGVNAGLVLTETAEDVRTFESREACEKHGAWLVERATKGPMPLQSTTMQYACDPWGRTS